MARDWKALFTTWAKPASETEEEQADRAARMVREAINQYAPLIPKNISVYGTGSYKNNTNTRLESDIDLAVVLHDCYFSQYPLGKPPQAEDLGHTGGATYGLAQFRADVGKALVQKFGAQGITPGNKAFDVHANTVRLDADVAVFLEHHRYTGRLNADGTWHYLEGVEMHGNGGARIINWHKQHQHNGVDKNTRTGRRYKRVVRVLKRLRDDMLGKGSPQTKAAADVPSFLLECLAYNAEDGCYQNGHLYEDVRSVVTKLWNKTKPDTENILVEVSGLKWLFGSGQPWTKATAHNFLLRAWQHVGFSR